MTKSSAFETRVDGLESYITNLSTDIITEKNIAAIKQLPNTLMEFDTRM
jgi:hypothetical protein